MENIIEEVFKKVHSNETNTRKKLKLTVFENDAFLPTEESIEWFKKRSIESCKIQEFIDLLFKEASEKKLLDFRSQTIRFDEIDAKDLGFTSEEPIQILDLFKDIPKVLKI